MRNLRTATAAAVLLGACLVMVSSAAAPATAAKSGVPPFCVKIGGPRGPDSGPVICRFFDYQICLQAAADLRGNCVVNVDFKGVVAPGGVIVQQPPAPPRRRRSD